jgi:hypothetical protein
MGWTLGVLEGGSDGEFAGAELWQREGPPLLRSGRGRTSRSSRSEEAPVVETPHAPRPACRKGPGRGESRTPHALELGG